MNVTNEKSMREMLNMKCHFFGKDLLPIVWTSNCTCTSRKLRNRSDYLLLKHSRENRSEYWIFARAGHLLDKNPPVGDLGIRICLGAAGRFAYVPSLTIDSHWPAYKLASDEFILFVDWLHSTQHSYNRTIVEQTSLFMSIKIKIM